MASHPTHHSPRNQVENSNFLENFSYLMGGQWAVAWQLPARCRAVACTRACSPQTVGAAPYHSLLRSSSSTFTRNHSAGHMVVGDASGFVRIFGTNFTGKLLKLGVHI